MKKLAYGIVLAFAAMAAADVFAAGTLPPGYTEIEYIQGPGNARIVTDYMPQPNTDKIEAVVECPANTIAANVNQAIWCARGNGLSVDSWTLFILGTQFRFDYMPSGDAVSLTPDFAISTGTKYTITAEDNTVTYSANGSVLQTQSTPAYSYTAGSALALFASHHSGINSNPGNYGKHRLYSFKVWRSGDLIHYFVPCKDAGGAATLVDICDNPATLTKSGTFTAGQAGHYYDDFAFGNLSILPIPTQLCLAGAEPEPGFTVSNTVTGAFWVFAEGGVAPEGCPFEASYSFDNGVGTVTATGKVGSEYEGESVKRSYNLTQELLVNGGFESGNWAPGWTASGNYAKIDTSTSAYGPNQTTTFISGRYCAILQKRNVATQVFTNDSPYGAEVSWKCKQRGGYSGVPYEVTIDGNRIFYEDFPTSTSEVHYRTVEDVLLPPGEHTLKFETFATADRTLFLDDVSLKIVSKRCVAALPIPDQVCGFVGGCRPEFTVSNVVNAQTWTIGGDIVSEDFDVTYSNNADPGVATVTVTGKGELADNVFTTTFNVYRRVKSITSTNSQYIDTGIVPGPNTAVEMYFNTTNSVDNTAYFGAGAYNANNSYVFYPAGGFYYFRGAGTTTGLQNEQGVDGFVSISTNAADNLHFSLGGNAVTKTVALTYAGSNKLNIFASNNGGNKSKLTLYSFKIWQDGELVRDFVPVRGNAVGLWDFVTSTFFGNAGTGVFAAGPDETDIAVARIPNQFYSGTALEPSVVVSNLAGTALLVKDVDYTVAYEDNDAVGTGKAIVTGIGAYGSVVTNEFAIYTAPTAAMPATAYVQHGLMNHWDAIDNVGTGTFDPTAKTWKDLKGSLDFALNGNADWGEGFLETHGYSGAAPGKTGKYLTIDVKYRNTKPRRGMMFASGYSLFRVLWNRSINQLWFHQANNETRNTLTGLDAAGTTYDFSVVYGAGGGGSDAPMLFYEGGVPHTTGISNQKFQSADFGWIASFPNATIGSGSENQCNYEGRIYSIRLYDCPLSAREIAYNAAVDKVRFDGVAPAEAFNAPDMRWNATSGKVEVFIDLSTLHGDGTLSINGGGASAWVSVGDEVSIVYAPATGEKALEWFGLPDGAPHSDDLFTVNFTAEAPVAAKLQMLKKIDIARALNADPGIEEGSGYFNDGVLRSFMPVSWNRTHSGAWLGTYGTSSDERGWHYLSPYQGPAFFQEGLALPAGNYTLTFDHAANSTDHTIYSWQLVDTNNAVQSICNVTNEMRIYGTSWHSVQADFTVAEGGIYKLQTVKIATGAHGNCYSLFDNVSITSDTDLHIEVEKCYPYFGEAQLRPPVVVRDDDGNVLTEGVDYELLYGANNSPGVNLDNAVSLRHGNGYVAAKGLGSHYGVAGANFRIGTPIYVKPDGLPSNGGTSWADAVDFATALNLAAATNINHEIWIAGSNVLASAATEKLFYGNKIFRGGFKGTESTIEEREPGSYSVIDGDGQFSAMSFRIQCNVFFERLHFRGSPNRAVAKNTWGGDMFVDDCVFEDNGNALYVHGVSKTPYSQGSLYVKNSIFRNNSSANDAAAAAALHTYYLRRTSAENSLFVSNTVTGAVAAKVKTSAIYANTSAVELKECDFIGNTCGGTSYGTVYATASDAKDTVQNCLFLGNRADGAYAAAVRFNHSSYGVVSEVVNCTFAGNVNSTANGCAGVKGVLGYVKVRNSIFYGNGIDFADYVNCPFDVDFTLLEDDTGATYNFADGSSKVGSSMAYGNPLFAAADDCHLLSEAGYFDSEGNIHYAAATVCSPAIDAGDPESDYSRESEFNGGCINLGRYGNTEEASRTPVAMPEVVGAPTVAWDDPDGYTTPTVTFTMGGTGAYSAHGTIYISTDGGTTWEDVSGDILGLANGQTKIFRLSSHYYFDPDSTIQVKVSVSAAGETSESETASVVVSGTTPPWYGKKGPDYVIHVREGANGRKDGSSWTDAYDSFSIAQRSLTDDANKTEIWVAGTIVESQAPLKATLAAPLVIRGGFAGFEETPDERAEGTYSTIDGNSAYDLLYISNPVAYPLAVERMVFTRARQYAFRNFGAGPLAVTNCQFIGNLSPGGDVTGRGTYLENAFTASFVNCIWRGNMKTAGGSSSTQGSAIYANGLTRLFLDDCLFVTNGMSAVGGIQSATPGRDQCNGDCLWMNGTPITARNCHFRGNRGGIRSGTNGTISGTGGVILLAGASGNSAFTNCTFAGNWGAWAENNIATSAMGAGGGALDIRLSTTGAKVDFEQCTLAYNLGDSRYCPGGLNVERGTVSMHNSIIFGNVRGSNATVGHDIHVLDSGRLNLSYCLLTAEDNETAGKPSFTYVSEASAGLITYDNLKFGDPLFATGRSDFTAYVKTSGAYTYLQNNTAGANFIANIDLHLRSIAGMSCNDGTRYEDEDGYSKAIDAGDTESAYSNEPDPNGGRVNIGGYGNTSEASCSLANVQPEIGTVEVVYSNSVARPIFSIPIAGSGVFLADVTVYAGVGSVIAGWQYTNTYHNVGNGDTAQIPFNSCVAFGDTISWRVVVSCDNASPREASGSAAVPAGLVIPEINGKGGGARIIHVGPGYVASLRNGTSWWDAYETVEEALAAMTADRHEIWVAADAVNRMASTMSFIKAYKTVIRGGFAGLENSPAERPQGLDTVVGGSGESTLLTIYGTSDIALERFRFERGGLRALHKSGAGDLDLLSCAFVSNGFSSAGTSKGVYPGKAVAFSGTGALSVTNCVFAWNCQTNDAYTTGGPGAALAVNSGRARVSDSIFFANCLPFAVPNGGNSASTLFDCFPLGSAIYATAPICIERCNFKANLCHTRFYNNSNGGGTVYFANGSSGSAVTNCLFAGNVDRASWNSPASARTGAIVLSLGAKAQTVDICGSTFAYNLSDTRAGSAGISVEAGTANVKNCVFTGNHIRRGAADDTADMRVVGANGVINLSHSVLDGNLAAVRSTCAGEFNEGEGIIEADPLIVTRPDDITNLIAFTGVYYYYPAGAEESIRGINAHLRGGRGYFDEKTGGLVLDYVRPGVSPAIDAGDPKSEYLGEPDCPQGWHGKRVNMGAYGNTPWATMTQPSGSVYYIR
ncbi:MAG: hypothetical protein IJG70_02235 [Kiritimatiellae bacterium]|nr:hypothetical protein [Kiritimatiellia bacterium]